MNHYPVELNHLFLSPAHNYFGRPKDGPGEHPTHDAEQVELVAGQGIRGDRYFGVAAHFEAQVTFVAQEVFEEVSRLFGRDDLSPIVMRRNIVTQGISLNQLIGQEFALVQGESSVRFLGAKACSPCAWMDVMIAPGAWKSLRGRGGLRARILSGGVLHSGPAILQTKVELETAQITQPLAFPRLP